MSEQEVVFVVIGIGAVLVVVVVALIGRRSSVVREMLRAVAMSSGWSGVTNLRMQAGVRGMWRSFAVSLAYLARQKGVPQRLVVKVGARSDVRLIVKRRFPGFLSNRPLTLFGPPLVELHAPAAASFWVRINEANMGERLFGDAAAAAAIDSTLVARFDQLRVNAKGLEIVRALDDSAVRHKYRMPGFTMRLDPALYEPLAREEWSAAEAVVGKLSLM